MKVFFAGMRLDVPALPLDRLRNHVVEQATDELLDAHAWQVT